jgi:glycosyltransferase involved in cell wall biosynthesis
MFYADLKSYVLKNKIEIIHTHHRFPEMIAVKIGRKLNIKTVLSTHGYTSGYKNISYNSDKIISVSKSMTDYLVNNFDVNELNIYTMYNPVEYQQQDETEKVKDFSDQMGINEKSKILLFVGRITKEKGYDSLLKSFEVVNERYKNIFLIMNGHLVENLFGYKSIVKNNKIILVPPQKNISYLYSIADIVILPSRIDSFPFVMIEAGSFKKPFIGGNTGGIAEFIENGKNGLLVDPENPKKLAEKIIYLINNPEVGKMLGENLFEKVNRLCNYNNYFDEVEKIYNSLLTAK